ncbi:MAG: hypothetical protein AAGI08_14320 [Bacteroidota bacterium]
MGQQQLLLITLGIVIVGIATMVGINAYSENAQRNERAQQRLIMLDIMSKAQAWKVTPEKAGGSPDVTKSDPYDFSELTYFDMGMAATGSHNDADVMYVTSVGCFKLFTYDTSLLIRVLEAPTCTQGTWEMGLEYAAEHEDESEGLFWHYRNDQIQR